MSKNGLPRKPLTKRRLKNLILNVLKNPFNMVVLVSLVILFCLIIIPLLTMIANTFTLAQGELRRVQGHVGDFTLYYWKYILASTLSGAVLWGPLKNSFICGFFTVLVSVPLGSVLAWLMIRTDIPGKKILGLLVTVPYMIPSWTKALAWLAMFRNSTSGADGFLAGMGIPIPDWLTAPSPSCCACPCTITHFPILWSPARSAPSTPSWRKWARFRGPARRRSCGTSPCP